MAIEQSASTVHIQSPSRTGPKTFTMPPTSANLHKVRVWVDHYGEQTKVFLVFSAPGILKPLGKGCNHAALDHHGVRGSAGERLINRTFWTHLERMWLTLKSFVKANLATEPSWLGTHNLSESAWGVME